jgi:hypothetical protein
MTTATKWTKPPAEEIPALIPLGFKKDNPTFPDTEYDCNLAGLYRPTIPVEVLGKRVRFQVPATDQVALTFQFLVNAWKDVLLSPDKQNKMTRRQVMQICSDKYLELRQYYLDSQAGKKFAKAQEQEFDELAGYMLLSPEANEYMVEAINQCFPDLRPAEELTTQAKMAAFGHIGEYINHFKEVLGDESTGAAATGT